MLTGTQAKGVLHGGRATYRTRAFRRYFRRIMKLAVAVKNACVHIYDAGDVSAQEYTDNQLHDDLVLRVGVHGIGFG